MESTMRRLATYIREEGCISTCCVVLQDCLQSPLSLVLTMTVFGLLSEVFHRYNSWTRIPIDPSANDLGDGTTTGVSAKLDTPQEPEPTLLIQDVGNSSAQVNDKLEPRSRLFALLIGINKYQNENSSMRRLQGAVPDAFAVRDYLHDVLRTKSSQIKMLIDEEATQKRIVNAINDLSTHPDIEKDDAILIYFAGHGGFTRLAGDKSNSSQIELIMPHDADHNTGHNVIRDEQLGSYLTKIAQAKGNNITLILDCCHSGDGARAEENNDGAIVRGVETSVPLVPETLDRGCSMAGGFAAYAETSHVLLAACGPDEKAREREDRGVFTKALLETLKKQGDIHNLTYEALITAIGTLNSVQNPQCEGTHKRGIIFGGKTPRVTRYLHWVECNNAGEYVMQAGKANGISVGARYLLFEDEASFGENHSLGTMEVQKVRDIATSILRPAREVQSVITSILEPVPDPQIAEHTKKTGLLALLITASENQILPVYAAESDKIYGKLRFIMQHSNEAVRPWGIKLVGDDDRKSAFIGLSLDGEGFVSIDILDEDCCLHNMGRLARKLKVNPNPDVLDDQNLSDFLESVAFFRWHLKRENPLANIAKGIGIEFSELVPKDFDEEIHFRQQYTPKTEVINGEEAVVNLHQKGKIELEIPDNIVDDGYIMTPGRYGFTVRNTIEVPLYVSVFFFSVGSLEIVPYYQPPFAAQNKDTLKPSLPAHDALTIGYGPGDQPAWRYGLMADEDMDLGFVMFYISTTPVQLLNLVQTSAFDIVRGGFLKPPESSFEWLTIKIPLIQRRASIYEPLGSP